MMQALGRLYVRYFNRRYIELNPVRACMVDEPSEYVWSSYQINALGKISSLCTPHPLYSSDFKVLVQDC